MRVLWNDPLGVKMIALAIFLQISGALIIRRLVQIEY
jgi:Flp pilus assembly protein TadB